MKLLKINYLYLFLLFFSNLIFAQDNGLEGWNSIGVSAKISDKVNVDISQHLKMVHVRCAIILICVCGMAIGTFSYTRMSATRLAKFMRPSKTFRKRWLQILE